jgi:hypothetical protein
MTRNVARGQANVIGVALLLGIAVVSMGALTAAVGTVVESTAAEADAERVASDLDSALQPVATTGPRRDTVTFSSGRLAPVDRTLEVRADGTIVERLAVDALVFESGDRRVAFHAGAIVRGEDGAGWLATEPPVTVGEDVIIVGAARLGDSVGTVAGRGGVTTSIESDVAHDRRDLGTATFSVAIETAAPNAWERAFREQGATVDREPGTPPTVVATFEGDRQGYLIIHDLNAEVSGDE